MMTEPEPSADTSTDRRILNAVHSVWGFDTLRPLQMEAIRAGLAQQDSLVVLPTGGGKSLCYQVPPLITDRMDVVVSPLISLMRDQVDALRQNGYPAAAIHSSLTTAERDRIRQGMRDNVFRLLFISPERLVSAGFMNYLQQQNIRSFAIDEAHCISQWGHDFRPEYRQLAQLRDRFPNASVHAYTATATERVRADIVERLSLRTPNVLVGTFDRPNLTYRIIPMIDVEAQTLEVIRRHANEAVIVYCLSRKDTEAMAEFLAANGVNAAAYHAGMESVRRCAVQDAFAGEQLDVVCATVAFGMGIDRSNVRCVIHASMPKSIEHYQQETGRAGRDGLEAECVLFYTAAGVLRWDRLIRKSAEQSDDPDATIRAATELLKHISAFCTMAKCRHRSLTEYFGQKYDKTDCGACDVCLNEVEIMEDSTTIAQKILSCVARLGQQFGVKYVVDILRGANTETVRQRGHDTLSTYGILNQWQDKVLNQLVYQLIDLGVLQRTSGDRPIVQLTEQSRSVLRGEQPVQLVKPAAVFKTTQSQTESWEGVDHALFDHLRELRKTYAAERSVPAYVIFSDATLRDLARRRPTTTQAMREVHGVGVKKLADFGEAFTIAIAEYCTAHEIDVDCDADAAGITITQVDIVRPKSGRSRPNPEKERAMDMLRDGAALAEVAEATGRAPSTIAGYLCELIADEPTIDIHNWVDVATYERIISAATKMNDQHLRPLFEALNEQVSYETIKLVLAHSEAQFSANSTADDQSTSVTN